MPTPDTRTALVERFLAGLALGDWPGLIALAQECSVPSRYAHPHDPSDYELEGDYSGDARYVYPTRQDLVSAIATVLRSAPEERGEGIQGVVFILVDGGRVLMEKCPKKAARHGAKWFIPGGRIEQTDATPSDAMIREMHEELGVRPLDWEALPLVDATGGDNFGSFLMRPFLVMAWEGVIPDHCLDHPDVPLRWVPLEEARRSPSGAVRAILAHLPIASPSAPAQEPEPSATPVAQGVEEPTHYCSKCGWVGTPADTDSLAAHLVPGTYRECTYFAALFAPPETPEKRYNLSAQNGENHNLSAPQGLPREEEPNADWLSGGSRVTGATLGDRISDIIDNAIQDHEAGDIDIGPHVNAALAEIASLVDALARPVAQGAETSREEREDPTGHAPDCEWHVQRETWICHPSCDLHPAYRGVAQGAEEHWHTWEERTKYFDGFNLYVCDCGETRVTRHYPPQAPVPQGLPREARECKRVADGLRFNLNDAKTQGDMRLRVSLTFEEAETILSALARPVAGSEERNGAALIAEERRRQIEGEWWTAEHDDAHTDGALVYAARTYLNVAIQANQFGPDFVRSRHHPPLEWPWAADWWKPSVDPIRNIVKAGALIAAEIDRLQRAGSNV